MGGKDTEIGALLARLLPLPTVAALSLSACSGEETIDRGVFTENACYQEASFAADATTTENVTYVSLRRYFLGSPPYAPPEGSVVVEDDDGDGTTVIVSEWGLECETDPETCDRPPPASFSDADYYDAEGLRCDFVDCWVEYLHTVDASGTATVHRGTDVIAAIAPVDTVAEAQFLAELRGFRLPCDGQNNVAASADGVRLYAESGNTCGGNVEGHVLRVTPEGAIDVEETVVIEEGDSGCAIGRLPPGHGRSPAAPAPTALGAHLRRIAELEAASIAAFAQLATELEHHGAPPRLIALARRCQADEVVHAELMAQLATDHGAPPTMPRVAPSPVRSLQELADDNRLEGCTRETLGALIARHQAHHAQTPELRRVFTRIARDETRHADFSWRLAAWLEERLGEGAFLRVADNALATFEASVLTMPEESVRSVLGLPSSTEAAALRERFRAAVA